MLKKTVVASVAMIILIAIGFNWNKPTLFSRPIAEIETMDIYIEGELVDTYDRSDIQDPAMRKILEKYNNEARAISLKDGVGQDYHFWLVVKYSNKTEDLLVVGESRDVLFRLVSLKQMILYRDDMRLLYHKLFEPYIENP